MLCHGIFSDEHHALFQENCESLVGLHECLSKPNQGATTTCRSARLSWQQSDNTRSTSWNTCDEREALPPGRRRAGGRGLIPELTAARKKHRASRPTPPTGPQTTPRQAIILGVRARHLPCRSRSCQYPRLLYTFLALPKSCSSGGAEFSRVETFTLLSPHRGLL